MMKKNIKNLLLATSTIYIFLGSTLYAQEKTLTLEDMLKASGLEINYKKIDSGEIVTYPRQDQESTDRSIALSMGVYLNASYRDVVDALKDEANTKSNYPDALHVEIKDIKNIKPYFKKVRYTSREKDEVEKLFDYKNGDDFNLGDDEINQWLSIVKKGVKSSTVASAFFQNVLEQRTDAYLDGGVSAIQGYDQSGKVDVAKGLKSSSMGLSSFKKWFPEFYKDYMNYPKVSSTKYKEKFFWTKDTMDDRPVFMLQHQMIEAKENIAMVTQRTFFISHGLDAIQMQMIILPYKNGTFVGLSSQSFTQKVTGFGRGIAVKVGRNMMTKQIKPMLDALQKKFN